MPAYPEIPEAWEECGQHSRKEIALKKSFQIGNSMIVFLILQTMHISIEKNKSDIIERFKEESEKFSTFFLSFLV